MTDYANHKNTLNKNRDVIKRGNMKACTTFSNETSDKKVLIEDGIIRGSKRKE